MDARQYIDQLFEATRYYHGTNKESAGQAILKDGVLKPPSAENLDARYGQVHQRPNGGVYLSTSLRYAVIYTLGGVMMGHKPFKDYGDERGYLFVADSDALATGDEDTLGAIPSILKDLEWWSANSHETKGLATGLKADSELKYQAGRLCRLVIPRNTYDRAAAGEAAWQSKAGKMLLRAAGRDSWSAGVVKKLSALSQNVSISGEIPWVEAWSIKKSDCEMVNPDCSNFFEVATRLA